MGYSPWGRKESHMTERLHLTLIKCPLGTYRKIRLKKERRRKEEEKKKERSRLVVSNSLWPHGLGPTRLLHPWNFLGKSTRVGCHFLLQGIFLTQGSNPGLPHCRQTLYCLSHQVSPVALHGVAKTQTWLSELNWSDLFFGEVSIKVFWPIFFFFLIQNICFLIVEF